MNRDRWSRRQFLRTSAAAGLGLAGTALAAGPARASAATRAGTVTSPATTAKLGVFAEPNGTTEHSYLDAFRNFESEIGRGVSVYRSYRSWGQPIFNSAIDDILNPSKSQYAPPELYLSFHPYLTKKGTQCLGWAQVASGCEDSVIDAWATQLNQLLGISGHAYVAFHHEMEKKEGTPPSGCGIIGNRCGTPEDFKAAYWYFRQRIQNRLQSAYGWDPSSITWVVTFMGDTFRGQHNGPDTWWPSSSDPTYPSDVADDHLVGVDLYNRYKCHNKSWYGFDYLAGLLGGKHVQQVQAYAASKGRNLFIGECGSVEGNACNGTLPFKTQKAEWFTGDASSALTVMQGWDNLEAFCYSQVVGQGNYRIDTSTGPGSALTSFVTLANAPLFS